MLSEEKIRIMTNLALFEKNEGEKIFPINRFFKSDYISGRLLNSFFSYTTGFFLCLILWGSCNPDRWMNTVKLGSILDMAAVIGIVYGIGLLAYLVISLIVSIRRYDRAGRGMKIYLAKLKRLDKRYEGGLRPAARTKGGRTQ